MFHLLLKTSSSLLLLFLHDNRVKSSKWNFWDYISLFTFNEESVDRWPPGNVHFPFLCLSCWRFVLPLMIFPETLCNSCWVIIGDKNALFPLSPSQPFFLHLLFIFHPEVVLLKKKKYWDCCIYRCRRKKLLHKISQVFPSIPKYSQVYLNIPLFHPQEDPSRMELSLGQPDREKIAKTAWEGNSTIISSDFGTITLLVVPLPKTIILPPARDYSSHLGLRNKTTWGVHRSRGPPQVIVV